MISYEFYLNLDRTKFGNSYLDNILNKQNIPNYSISLKTYLKKVELDLRNLNFFNNVKTGLLASLFVPWCYHLKNVIFFNNLLSWRKGTFRLLVLLYFDTALNEPFMEFRKE